MTDAPQVDRKELLNQQFDEVAAAATPAVVEPSTPETKADRARDEAGKFTAANGVAPEKTLVEQTAPVLPAAVEEPAWKRAPHSWKKDYHELYTGLDPKLQEYVFQREEQMRAGVEPLIPKAKFADDVNRALEPYMGTIRGLGIEPAAAVGALAQADHQLRTLPYQQKVAYAANLLAGYGLDLGNLGAVPQQQVQNPDYYALQNELLAIRGQVNSWNQQQEQIQTERLTTEINGFASKAEHFEEVRGSMIQLLQSGVASTLQEAYDKAIRLDDQLFETITASKQAAAQSAKIASANTAAKAAKAAAVSVKSSTPGAQTPTNAKDRRSMLREALDGIDGRI